MKYRSGTDRPPEPMLLTPARPASNLTPPAACWGEEKEGARATVSPIDETMTAAM